MPFFGAIVLSTFPSGINLYWGVLSFSNLVFAYTFKSLAFNKFMGIPEVYPGSILEK